MGGIRKAAAWLGIVPDDRYDSYDDVDDAYDEYTEQFSDEPVEEPSTTVTPINRENAVRHDASTDLETTGASAVATQRSPRPAVVPSPADLSRIVTVHPRTYNEARTIGEHFRDGVPVIMNVSDMDDSDAKRLIDFAAGLTFGLRGTIEKVTNRVFLLSPPNVNVTAEDKERIASGGFFNQS